MNRNLRFGLLLLAIFPLWMSVSLAQTSKKVYLLKVFDGTRVLSARLAANYDSAGRKYTAVCSSPAEKALCVNFYKSYTANKSGVLSDLPKKIDFPAYRGSKVRQNFYVDTALKYFDPYISRYNIDISEINKIDIDLGSVFNEASELGRYQNEELNDPFAKVSDPCFEHILATPGEHEKAAVSEKTDKIFEFNFNDMADELVKVQVNDNTFTVYINYLSQAFKHILGFKSARINAKYKAVRRSMRKHRGLHKHKSEIHIVHYHWVKKDKSSITAEDFDEFLTFLAELVILRPASFDETDLEKGMNSYRLYLAKQPEASQST